jgi:hypothetical protein
MEVQKRVNAITFMAALEKAQALGKTGKDAVDYAESAVRVTQSGGGLKDLAGIQSGGEIGKSLTPFYTYFSLLYNRLYETGRRDLLKGFVHGGSLMDRARGAHAFSVNMIWLIFAPAAAVMLMKGADDDEEWGKQYLMEAALTATATLPLGRDIASSLLKGFDPSTPISRALTIAAKGGAAVGDIFTGEFNNTDLRNLLKLPTLFTALPFNTAIKIAESAQLNDPVDMARGVAFGVPYEKRVELIGEK